MKTQRMKKKRGEKSPVSPRRVNKSPDISPRVTVTRSPDVSPRVAVPKSPDLSPRGPIVVQKEAESRNKSPQEKSPHRAGPASRLSRGYLAVPSLVPPMQMPEDCDTRTELLKPQRLTPRIVAPQETPSKPTDNVQGEQRIIIPELPIADNSEDFSSPITPRGRATTSGETRGSRRRAGTFTPVSAELRMSEEKVDYKGLFESAECEYLSHGMRIGLPKKVVLTFIAIVEKQKNADYYPCACLYLGQIYIQGLVDGTRDELAAYEAFKAAACQTTNEKVQLKALVWLAGMAARGMQPLGHLNADQIMNDYLNPLEKEKGQLAEEDKLMLFYLIATVGSLLYTGNECLEMKGYFELCIDQNANRWIKAAAQLHLGDLLANSFKDQAEFCWQLAATQDDNPFAKTAAERRLNDNTISYGYYENLFLVPWFEHIPPSSPKAICSPKNSELSSPPRVKLPPASEAPAPLNLKTLISKKEGINAQQKTEPEALTPPSREIQEQLDNALNFFYGLNGRKQDVIIAHGLLTDLQKRAPEVYKQRIHLLLGEIYYKKEPLLAFEYFKIAAGEQGLRSGTPIDESVRVKASMWLGDFYSKDYDENRNAELAKTYFAFAEKNKTILSKADLALLSYLQGMYLLTYGTTDSGDKQKSFDLLSEAAKQTDNLDVQAEASIPLGDFYCDESEQCVVKNKAEAEKYWKIALKSSNKEVRSEAETRLQLAGMTPAKKRASCLNRINAKQVRIQSIPQTAPVPEVDAVTACVEAYFSGESTAQNGHITPQMVEEYSAQTMPQQRKARLYAYIGHSYMEGINGFVKDLVKGFRYLSQVCLMNDVQASLKASIVLARYHAREAHKNAKFIPVAFRYYQAAEKLSPLFSEKEFTAFYQELLRFYEAHKDDFKEEYEKAIKQCQIVQTEEASAQLRAILVIARQYPVEANQGDSKSAELALQYYKIAEEMASLFTKKEYVEFYLELAKFYLHHRDIEGKNIAEVVRCCEVILKKENEISPRCTAHAYFIMGTAAMKNDPATAAYYLRLALNIAPADSTMRKEIERLMLLQQYAAKQG